MGYSRDRAALLTAAALTGAGASAAIAGDRHLWLAMTGASLVAVWAATVHLLLVRRRPPPQAVPASEEERAVRIDRMLLDASPTPLVRMDDGSARALNRAARRLFDADDRIVAPPPALFDRAATHVHHAGRHWRADRIDVGGQQIAALIDVEGEERIGEERARAEMIQVLGHELLNGLVPIVSLAELGMAALDAPDDDRALLPEILATLARRAEGLRAFAEDYRTLARLPPPFRQRVAIGVLIDDLARLFVTRWPRINLLVTVEPALSGALDRDQVSQALWALLQNAAEAIEQVEDGQGRVTVEARADGDGLVVEIGDTGPGVPPDRTSSIFRPFHTTKIGGSGIGLSLARQVMRAHGGDLTLGGSGPTIFVARVSQAGCYPTSQSSA